MGVSFQEYLQDIRMKQAAGLLRSTRLPVRDIALAAGYHNSSHFHHLFQRHFGMSPADFRAAHPSDGPD
ncbi:helix-turn-helix transcriptional regulator [uncultured Acetatifactor sp.]|uniref:helix-turn-helix transcriptional regulator n=1 Tax=uncultured Acetatifactor sp. TaxID=1671927 RepID=UPI002629A4C6|nr:helix-turn-helix transcriptional regulator [uncultured Acetatifactor sp.]